MSPLPNYYTCVQPVQLWKNDLSFPATTVSLNDFQYNVIDFTSQYSWLDHVKGVLEDKDSNEIQDLCISWAATMQVESQTQQTS